MSPDERRIVLTDRFLSMLRRTAPEINFLRSFEIIG
jgi:hypothetical protein